MSISAEKNKWIWGLSFSALLLASTFLFSQFERQQFSLLLSFYALMFIAYGFIAKLELRLKEVVLLGIAARVAMFFSIPNLSDDFYRFVFDGNLIIDGINPYRVLPVHFLGNEKELTEVINNLNSPRYYTIYPPLNQLLFTPLAALYFKNKLLAIGSLRLLLVIADLLSVYFIIKICERSNLKNNVLSSLYFLNPLIILEFTGNLHFEGVVICFILASIYFLFRNKNFHSGLFIGMAFLTKLTPLIALPFLIRSSAKNAYIKILLGFLVICVLMIFPFYDSEILKNIFSSVELFYQRFEFNASIYYLLREIGEFATGYNQIKYLGPALGLVAAFIIIWKLNKQKNNIFAIWPSLLVAFCTLFMLSTTVHPWYIALVLVPGIFLGYLFPIVWTLTVFLSYSAYSGEIVSENYYLIIIEYVLVLLILIWELRRGPFLRKIISRT